MRTTDDTALAARQLARVQRCRRHLRRLKGVLADYRLDPSGWRAELLFRTAEELCEALADTLDGRGLGDVEPERGVLP